MKTGYIFQIHLCPNLHQSLSKILACAAPFQHLQATRFVMIFSLVFEITCLFRCMVLVLDWPAGMFNYIPVTLKHTSAFH